MRLEMGLNGAGGLGAAATGYWMCTYRPVKKRGLGRRLSSKRFCSIDGTPTATR